MVHSHRSHQHRKHASGAVFTAAATGDLHHLPLRENVRRLVEGGHYAEALRLCRDRTDHEDFTNIRGVCLMRMGKYDEALRTYRGLVLRSGSVLLRAGQPLTYHVNFATALMLAGHPRGAADVLTEINHENHPRVVELRQALKRWRTGLPLWQQMMWFLGLELPGRVTLDFPPGEIDPPAV